MTDQRYSRLAAEHLPADLAQRFTALLRPCLRLRAAADGEQAVATLGGSPQLPAGTRWPEWAGHGPLSFIASVQCAALPRDGLATDFPQDGTLLFFSFDGRAGGTTDGSFFSADALDEAASARVLYVPEDTPLLPIHHPQGLEPYPPVQLAAGTEESAPDLWLPQVRKILLADGGPWPHPRDTPAELRAFLRAFEKMRTRIGHQLSGHAVPIQGPVEYEIANATLGGVHAWGDDALDREAERWILLAQFDSDSEAKMTWGDSGALYWLIRADDLAAHRFDQARLTLQR